MKLTSALLGLLVLTAPVGSQQSEFVQVVPPPAPVANVLYNNFAGKDVAMSEEWIAVGDYAAGRTGEVYLYRKTPSGWEFVQRILEAPATNFGSSLAIQGDTLIIGEYMWGWPVNLQGKAYVYEWSGSEWTKTQELIPGGLWSHDDPEFGWTLALSGDVLAVSAVGADHPVQGAGAVFVYERIQGTWVLVERFALPAVPDVLNKEYGFLGTGLAISGNTIVAGASKMFGAALVYERGPSGWSRTALLENPTPEWNDSFGYSADISGDTIVVGMPVAGGSETRIGEAYIYERDAIGDWALTREIRASDGFQGDYFGFCLALEGDRLAVGAPNANLNGPFSGTVYLFARTQAGYWPATEKVRMVASDPHPVWGEHLGWAVDLHQDFVLAGAPNGWAGNIRPGKALVFTIELGTSYCEPTSPGPHATLAVTGSEVARRRRLTLTARDAPAEAHGVFLVSNSPGSLPFGSHQLCLGAPVVRLSTALTGIDGIALHDVDWTDPGLAGKLAAGATSYYQFVHAGKGSGQRIELSNAISLTLQ